jgi:hypothetical protein
MLTPTRNTDIWQFEIGIAYVPCGKYGLFSSLLIHLGFFGIDISWYPYRKVTRVIPDADGGDGNG